MNVFKRYLKAARDEAEVMSVHIGRCLCQMFAPTTEKVRRLPLTDGRTALFPVIFCII